MTECPAVSGEQLVKINRQHISELKKLKRMNEVQFQIFKRNFSVGCLDNVTKLEAEELLRSMVALNLKIQEEIRESSKVS